MARRAQIFRSDAASRYLPWLLVLAVFLATCALAGLLVAERTLAKWEASAPYILTLQLPPSDSAATDSARADALSRRLRAEPGVAAVELLPRTAVGQMLRPWLGEDVEAAELPLPQVLHVQLKPDSVTDAKAIEKLAAGVVAGAIVDDHRAWRTRLVDYVEWLRTGIAGALALVIVVTGLTALFLTLSRMAIHHDVITLLHQLGAPDGYIVRGLVRQAGISALFSAVVGFGLAAVLLLALSAASAGMDSTFLPVLRADASDWLWLAIVPLGFVLLTIAVATRTAFHRLRRML